MKIFIFILTMVFTTITSFQKKPLIVKSNRHMSKKEPHIIGPELIKKLLMNYDPEFLQNYIQNTLPMFPQNEDDIEEDSFEGYLKSNFNVISDIFNEVDLETFYVWRKQIGTVLTKDEISEIFYTITGDEQTCKLIDFIKINIIIDENDGADFN